MTSTVFQAPTIDWMTGHKFEDALRIGKEAAEIREAYPDNTHPDRKMLTNELLARSFPDQTKETARIRLGEMVYLYSDRERLEKLMEEYPNRTSVQGLVSASRGKAKPGAVKTGPKVEPKASWLDDLEDLTLRELRAIRDKIDSLIK